MKTKFIIILFFIFVNVIILNAQRPPCDSGYTLLVYDVGQMPSKFPVLKLDMPYEAMLFYIWLWEWSKENHFNTTFIDSIHLNDEFKELIKRMYIATEYDPVLFAKQVNYQDPVDTIYPIYAINTILRRYQTVVSEPSLYWALLEADVIAKVKLNKIEIREYNYHLYNVIEAEVLDVIKGNTIPTCKDFSIPKTSDDFARTSQPKKILKPGECIQFNYQYDNLYGKEGKELVVFIDNYFWCNDSTSNYYITPNILLFNQQFPYFYFIESDTIQYYDNYRMFNLGENLTYHQWKEKLLGKINNILNKTYTNVDSYFDEAKDVVLYPMPAKEFINIHFNSKKNLHPIKFTIYDILGNIVEKHETTDYHYKLNLKSYNSGIYYLKIIKDNASLYKTFVVLK